MAVSRDSAGPTSSLQADHHSLMGQDQSGLSKDHPAAVYRASSHSSRSAHQRSASSPMAQNPNAASSPPPYSPVDPSSMTRSQTARVRGSYEPPLPQLPQGNVPQLGTPRRASTQYNPFTSQSNSPPPVNMTSRQPPPRQTGIIEDAPPRRQSTQPPNRNSSSAGRPTQEDPLLQLKKYDTVIVVDDSSSMAGALWWEAKEALTQLAELAAKYDEDGIDVHFLNSTKRGIGLGAAQVRQLFDQVDPDGITPTGEKLEELLLDYLLKLEHAKSQAEATGDQSFVQQVKPVNFLVITDGAPSDDPETVLVTAARRLDDGRFPISQVGIQFVQIGSDPSATEALRELDDDLAGKYRCRDIVDTTPYTGSSLDATTLTKALLGGINRRVDRRGAQ